jgi:hypothetical protein
MIKLYNTENEYKLIISIEDGENFIKFQLLNMQNQNEMYYLENNLEQFVSLDKYFRMFDSITECADNLSHIIRNSSPRLTQENEKMSLKIRFAAGQDEREVNLILDKQVIESNQISNELREEINRLKTRVNDLEISINQKDIMINEIRTNHENLKKSYDSFVKQTNLELMNLKSLLPQQNKNFNNINPNPNFMTFDELRRQNSNEVSSIIDNNIEIMLLSGKFRELYPGKNVIYNLLYRMSRDSDKSSVFHAKCDKISGTLVVIKTEAGLKFGGYTNATWEGNNTYKSDKSAFIYSLNNNKIYDIMPNCNAILCSPFNGPCFCGKNVATLLVYDNSDMYGGACSDAVNSNYKGYNSDYEINKGKNEFKIAEYEVFKVNVV